MNEVDEMKANNCTGLHSTSTSLGFFFLGRGGGGRGVLVTTITCTLAPLALSIHQIIQHLYRYHCILG